MWSNFVIFGKLVNTILIIFQTFIKNIRKTTSLALKILLNFGQTHNILSNTLLKFQSKVVRYIQTGICAPSSCSEKDLKIFITEYLVDINGIIVEVGQRHKTDFEYDTSDIAFMQV